MRHPARSTAPLLLAAAMCLPACSGESEPPPEYPPVEEPEPVAVGDEAPAEAEPPEPEPPPPPPVQVVAAERTPIEGAAPTLRVLSPRNNQLVRGTVSVRVQLRNWELAADPGNHVHVILDNEPYMAVRDVSAPLNLNELVQQNLGHELAPGTHVLRLFPSRAHHESVKEGSPFAVVVFHYQERTEGFELDARAPLLTYSRPKGCSPSGQRLLLDFYLSNVESLSAEGTRVRYTIDGQTSGDITAWAPHYIENLPDGEHTLELQLVGEDGQTLPGPFNDTTRTIRVGGCE